MGKLQEFYVSLDNNNNLYHSGDLVSGKLVVRAKDRFKINNVNIEFIGEAKVHWKEYRTISTGQNTFTTTIPVKDNENYFNENQILICKESGNAYIEMGVTEFPFQFKLPPNIPSSFKNRYGDIQYYIKGNIDKPWAIDKHFEAYFTVIDELDLNLNPLNRQGSHATGQKNQLLSSSEPIHTHISTTKVGYVPGELIQFTIEIDNKTNKELKECRVNLIQDMKFYAKRKTKSNKNIVATKLSEHQVYANDKFVWNGYIKIPPVCPSINHNTSRCNIIKIDYLLGLYVDVSTFSRSHELYIPITIGTIPLNGDEVKRSLLSYESFDGIPQNADDNDQDDGDDEDKNSKNKGQMFENNHNSYVPLYPSFKFD